MLAYALTVLLHIFALKISGISSIKLEKNEKRKKKKNLSTVNSYFIAAASKTSNTFKSSRVT
jgi:quinol-cytochrome oxidoreductase complex cytochrome b subunit